MKKKLVRLTESDLHKIIKESVKKVIRESNWGRMDGSNPMNSFNNEDSFDDEMEMNPEGLFKWSIYIFDKEIHSQRIFHSMDEAEADCSKKMNEINFDSLCQKHNNDDDFEENVMAQIDLVSEDGEVIDTMLINSGFGWYE